MTIGSFNAADLAMLAVLLLSMALGAWRGLVFEVMSLLGWFAAYLAAQWFSAPLAPHVPVGSPGSPLNQAAAFALAFIAALVVWSLLARLLKMLIHATPLSGVDRLLGAVFGVLRGGVLLLAVAAVVMRTPWAETPTWQHSAGAAALRVVLTGLKPALPKRIADQLPL
ncbi:MAG: colicin V synthesis protein [Burkholderiales bacterium PBB1]|nr:MAG: colicin V synthesis protein [Burkholderiales bacterium PBB1]